MPDREASREGRGTTLILGGGVSGLAAAQALQARGRPYLLLERCPTLGGLTRSVNVSEFCFDYTGHFLHLARVSSPAELPFASLDDAEWQRIERRSFCLVAGKLVPAPLQYNLGALPEPVRRACVDSYEARPLPPAGGAGSFRDFIVSGFGRELAGLFLIPQNEKTLSTSLDRLSPHGIRRFFPPPDEGRIRAGIRSEAP
ncbi:MAG: NAD(P)-binding protein, partial [Deltaproteobacteria bacterium]|nr:NAD(P)-binding protein [Deltaproteobacteria bacterium]